VPKTALIIGNSDGIGLGLTRSLLSGGWSITGISRSDSEVRHPQYRHIISEVLSNSYPGKLRATLESLALALRDSPVKITNLRFGFVDTKMAKGDRKPFMMTVDKAVHHLKKCIEKKPVRYSAPRIAIPFVKLHKLLS
jgi:NAD(P)-dependent dehydrogenase (short-subunit alcohol dehydrogenase family)